jgi:hypothetical protein
MGFKSENYKLSRKRTNEYSSFHLSYFFFFHYFPLFNPAYVTVLYLFFLLLSVILLSVVACFPLPVSGVTRLQQSECNSVLHASSYRSSDVLPAAPSSDRS